MSLASWGDIVTKNPSKPRGYNSLGLAYARLGKFDKALALYEQALYLYKQKRVGSKEGLYNVYINRGVANVDMKRL